MTPGRNVKSDAEVASMNGNQAMAFAGTCASLFGSRHSEGQFMHATDPIVTFVLVLVIGVVAGILFDRLVGPSWLARQSRDRPAARSRARSWARPVLSSATTFSCCSRSAAGW
jgi:hypothetical protein